MRVFRVGPDTFDLRRKFFEFLGRLQMRVPTGLAGTKNMSGGCYPRVIVETADWDY